MDQLIPDKYDEENASCKTLWAVYERGTAYKGYIRSCSPKESRREAERKLKELSERYGPYGRKFILVSQVIGPLQKRYIN